MTTPAAPTAAPDAVAVPLSEVESELARQLKAVQAPGEKPVLRACLSNLVIFCDQAALAQSVAAEVPAIVAVHPARVLLLISEPGSNAGELTSAVCVRAHRARSGREICSEQVTLHARGPAIERLPYAVRGLLIGDLPTNLWWAAPEPPPLAGALLYDLAEHAQQIIYDSLGWVEPARGVVAVASWLPQIEGSPGQGPWRVVSDLNWRRLKYWRRLLGQALDPASAPGALESITELLVEHGPHAVIQAWELVSWLAARLGWRVQAGKVQPGVEICWRVQAYQGEVRIRIRRLAEGPSEVRRLRLACTLHGKPGALNLVVEDQRRLAVVPEGIDAAARTVTVQPQARAGLVGRQLSDRERDPIFRESMAVAGVLAQGVLD